MVVAELHLVLYLELPLESMVHLPAVAGAEPINLVAALVVQGAEVQVVLVIHKLDLTPT